MLLSLAIIFLVWLSAAALFERIGLPRIIGMLGVVVGIGLYLLFDRSYQHKHKIRNSTKVMILLGTAFLLMGIETLVKPYVALSGLLAVVAMACVVKLKADSKVSSRLSE